MSLKEEAQLALHTPQSVDQGHPKFSWRHCVNVSMSSICTPETTCLVLVGQTKNKLTLQMSENRKIIKKIYKTFIYGNKYTS